MNKNSIEHISITHSNFKSYVSIEYSDNSYLIRYHNSFVSLHESVNNPRYYFMNFHMFISQHLPSPTKVYLIRCLPAFPSVSYTAYTPDPAHIHPLQARSQISPPNFRAGDETVA